MREEFEPRFAKLLEELGVQMMTLWLVVWHSHGKWPTEAYLAAYDDDLWIFVMISDDLASRNGDVSIVFSLICPGPEGKQVTT